MDIDENLLSNRKRSTNRESHQLWAFGEFYEEINERSIVQLPNFRNTFI